MTKRIVIPGELVTEERKKLGSHVFVSEGKIYSDSMGLVNDEADFASVVPLEGKYMPEQGDLIIGVIGDEKFSVYIVDVNSFYQTAISKKELREMLKPGAVISAKVSRVNELNEVDLENPRAFFGGEIIELSPVKIPRFIGREASMLNLIKDWTKSNIVVGRNGRIWAKGGDTDLLKKAVKKIDKEAHMENLTNRMEEFLEKNAPKNGVKKEVMEEDMEEGEN